MLTTRQWAESILLADCPYEDLTTVGLGIEETCGTVSASLKAPGIAAGIDLAREIFLLQAHPLKFSPRTAIRSLLVFLSSVPAAPLKRSMLLIKPLSASWSTRAASPSARGRWLMRLVR